MAPETADSIPQKEERKEGAQWQTGGSAAILIARGGVSGWSPVGPAGLSGLVDAGLDVSGGRAAGGGDGGIAVRQCGGAAVLDSERHDGSVRAAAQAMGSRLVR